jgi:hypothetical protein
LEEYKRELEVYCDRFHAMITEKRQIRREKDRFVCRPSYRDNLDNDSHEETISIVSKNFTGQTWAMEKS